MQRNEKTCGKERKNACTAEGREDNTERIRKILYETVKYCTMVSGLLLAILLMVYYDRMPVTEDIFLPDTTEEEVSGENTDEESPSVLIPHCGDISYTLSTRKNDFSFSNPSENTCLLRVSITRRDTSETIYVSSLISPGKSVSDVTFFRDFPRVGDYDAMIKIDAYRSDFGTYSLVNSMVLNVTVHVV